MNTYCKTLDLGDYKDLEEQDGILLSARSVLDGTFNPYHDHRHWEYGLALKLASEMDPSPDAILDVGGGGSFLGAVLAGETGAAITVVDPNPNIQYHKLFLEQGRRLGILNRLAYQQRELLDFLGYCPTNHRFDLVTCVSVLEHLPVPDDLTLFRSLLGCVAPGGRLFLTVDFHPTGYRLSPDHLRTYNEERLSLLIVGAIGKGDFVLIGTPDYRWHGPAVNGYTFASLGLERVS